MICNDVALDGVELEAALAEALNTPSGTADIPAWTDTKIVGQRLPKIDAYERVSGTAVYPSDVSLPGMLHAAVLRCPLQGQCVFLPLWEQARAALKTVYSQKTLHDLLEDQRRLQAPDYCI